VNSARAGSPGASNGPGGAPHVMRIYTRLEVGGIEQQLLRTLPRLAARGRYRVSLCLLRSEGALAEPLRDTGVPVHVLPARGRLHPALMLGLRRLFLSESVRIVHAHTYGANTSATVAARLTGVPAVIGSIHNMDTIVKPRRLLQERCVARMRDLTLAVSERVRRNYMEATGLPASRTGVLYNGIDTAPYDGLPRDPAAAFREFGIAPGRPVVICVARLVEFKRHEGLLAAARTVVDQRPEALFLFVGDGPCEQHLRAETARLGLSGNVVFAGLRMDTPALLRASTVSVLASRKEGFSNVVIESLAAGVPMVATDVGGNSEAVEDGISGFIVPPGDDAALAAGILSLLNDPVLLARMQAAARARAETFSLDSIVLRTEAIYDRLLGREGGG